MKDLPAMYEDEIELVQDFGIAKLVINVYESKILKIPMYYLMTYTFRIASEKVAMQISPSRARKLIESNGDKELLELTLNQNSRIMRPVISRGENQNGSSKK